MDADPPSPSRGGTESGYDVVVHGRRVIAGGRESPMSIGIRGGVIRAVQEDDHGMHAPREFRYDDDVVIMPGIVDSHVHVCEPGTDWEGFETATRAAAAGGMTTLVDMPIDSFPPITDLTGLQAKREAARGRCHIDVGFWGGAVAGNRKEMRPLVENGVLGFKCFMIDPGVEGFPPLDAEGMEGALAEAARLDVPLLIHAETTEIAAPMPAGQGRRYADYLASRPSEMEDRAIAQIVEAARRTRGHAHVVHLSSADAVPMIAASRQEGVPVTAETCPHYLTMAAEDIRDGETAFKCGPPIRERGNRERLWQALAAGTISLIGSDHSPCTVEMKHFDTGDFMEAWGGISSLQLSLPLVWTSARQRGHSLVEVAAWMAAGPARLAGLARKGGIAPGRDADFCILATDESFVVKHENLFHRNPVTPYVGRTLTGVVRETWLRGEPIDPANRRGEFLEGREGNAS